MTQLNVAPMTEMTNRLFLKWKQWQRKQDKIFYQEELLKEPKLESEEKELKM